MPEKFNMDYRRATFSSQIVSGQISRETALEELKKLPYELEKIEIDKKYITKKYSIFESKLEEYLNNPPKTFKKFPNDRIKIEWFYSLHGKIIN
jgi:hypothetical protein